MTQEALTNVMKHADASRPVDLTIAPRDGGVTILVKSARARDSPQHVDGHGVIGMTERMDLVGGRLVAGRTGPDWVVDAWLPTAPASAEGVRG